MNERIKAFADECFDVMPDERSLEQFAELIVRQCAEVARYYYTRNECVSPTQFKQHFGIQQ